MLTDAERELASEFIRAEARRLEERARARSARMEAEREAASILRISEATLAAWRAEGRLPK